MPLFFPTFPYVLIASLLYMFAFFVILNRSRMREGISQLLSVYVGIAFLWTLSLLLPDIRIPNADPQQLSRISYYGVFVLTVIFFQLSKLFLRSERGWPWWWVIGTAWIALVILLNENPFGLPEILSGGLSLSLLVTILSLGGMTFWIIASTILFLRVERTASNPLHRNRYRYWGIVGLLTSVGAFLFLFGYLILGGTLYALGLFAAVYVTTTYRLLDIRRATQQATVFLFASILTIAIYTVAQWSHTIAPRYFPQTSDLIIWIGISIILTLLINPLIKQIERWFQTLIVGTTYDPRAMLREYSTQISNILDLNQLASMVIAQTSEALGVSHATLFVVHYETTPMAGTGHYTLRNLLAVEGESEPPIFDAKSPVIEYFATVNAPLTQYDIDLLPRFRNTSADERAWLASLDIDVYVPIHSKGKWIGLMALGPKTSRTPYDDDDLLLLSTLADQTAVAFENARLYDDLKLRNEENERLNLELTMANEELSRLDRAKSDFINIASHELRTPLTQVRGYTDMLGESVSSGTLDPATGSMMVNNLKKASLRLQGIIDMMFDVSKLDTQTLELDISPTQLASVVNDALEDWLKALKLRGQQITISGLDDLPTIQGDRLRLTQVFSHLIQNAIKYTPDGGQIFINGRLMSADETGKQPMIEILIADTGIGIAKSDLEKIFLKFYRVGDPMLHSTGASKFKGAGPGLGLTLARGVIESHGGKIWAESPGYDEKNCPGSTFHIWLPLEAIES